MKIDPFGGEQRSSFVLVNDEERYDVSQKTFDPPPGRRVVDGEGHRGA
ncbi:hypothetical protein [Mycobacterium sp. 94-17]|nr:hypothetical protein [Mycobacterium sp. 94-17]MEB4212034.1 MbtH family NRPS accessory protein [Mycobacterium sp. 94-17]